MTKDDSSALTRDIAPFGVRMPADLKDRVGAAAKANGRSMNAEIVATLEEKYPAPVLTDELLDFATRLSALVLKVDPKKRVEFLNDFEDVLRKIDDDGIATATRTFVHDNISISDQLDAAGVDVHAVPLEELQGIMRERLEKEMNEFDGFHSQLQEPTPEELSELLEQINNIPDQALAIELRSELAAAITEKRRKAPVVAEIRRRLDRDIDPDADLVPA